MSDHDVDRAGNPPEVNPDKIEIYHLRERIAELEDQNMRLRLALLEFKERYSCSPWIHRQVDEAIRKEIT